MASYTETANCAFQLAEGKTCGAKEVYGAGQGVPRFCWAHYILRCTECQVQQSLFECAMVTAAGTLCRVPLCSATCYKAHQKAHHSSARGEMPRRVPIQVVFADGSIHDHMAPESSLVEEIVFEHPLTKERARCLRKPDAGSIVYAEWPRVGKPLPAPFEVPRSAPAPKATAPFQTRHHNAVTAFSLHVSWLTALIETRDERILRVIPADVLRRLGDALVETTVALLESNNHVG